MLGDFPSAQKDHGYVDVVALAQDGIGVDVDFVQCRDHKPQQWADLSLGLFAKVATRTGVQRNVEGSAKRKAAVFSALVNTARRCFGRCLRIGEPQPATCDERRNQRL